MEGAVQLKVPTEAKGGIRSLLELQAVLFHPV